MGDTITLVTAEDLRAGGDRFWETEDRIIERIMRYGQMGAAQEMLKSLRLDAACLRPKRVPVEFVDYTGSRFEYYAVRYFGNGSDDRKKTLREYVDAVESVEKYLEYLRRTERLTEKEPREGKLESIISHCSLLKLCFEALSANFVEATPKYAEPDVVPVHYAHNLLRLDFLLELKEYALAHYKGMRLVPIAQQLGVRSKPGTSKPKPLNRAQLIGQDMARACGLPVEPEPAKRGKGHVEPEPAKRGKCGPSTKCECMMRKQVEDDDVPEGWDHQCRALVIGTRPRTGRGVERHGVATTCRNYLAYQELFLPEDVKGGQQKPKPKPKPDAATDDARRLAAAPTAAAVREAYAREQAEARDATRPAVAAPAAPAEDEDSDDAPLESLITARRRDDGDDDDDERPKKCARLRERGEQPAEPGEFEGMSDQDLRDELVNKWGYAEILLKGPGGEGWTGRENLVGWLKQVRRKGTQRKELTPAEPQRPEKKRHRPSRRTRDEARDRVLRRVPLTLQDVDALDFEAARMYAVAMGVSKKSHTTRDAYRDACKTWFVGRETDVFVPAKAPAAPRQRWQRSLAPSTQSEAPSTSRGKYKCGRCGQIKVNHICPFAGVQSSSEDDDDEEGALESAVVGGVVARRAEKAEKRRREEAEEAMRVRSMCFP